jgi:cytoskeletal protein CcmA (bactofilin family)
LIPVNAAHSIGPRLSETDVSGRSVMTAPKALLASLVLLALIGPVRAEMQIETIGGDTLMTGSGPTGPIAAARDVVAAGTTVTLGGTVAQDTHAMGFDVEIDATTAGDLTAMGFSLGLRGPVGGDLTASGFTLRISRAAEIGGNARLAGGTITIDGPVKGSLAAMGAEVTLNAEVSGDVRITAETVSFGPQARIGGTLTYSAAQRSNIPTGIVGADHITFIELDHRGMMRDAGEMWSDWQYPVLPTFMSLFGGFLITLGFFFVIGAIFLSSMPNKVAHLEQLITARPGMALLSGAIGLSILFGLVPISILTIIGIPLVPIVLLATIAVWTLGYILGTYSLAMRALRGAGSSENPTIWIRLLALLVGVTLIALLNFIPFLGWMANFAMVLIGIGAMTMALFDQMIGSSDGVPNVDLQPVNKKQK